MKKPLFLVLLPLLSFPLFAQNTDLRGLKTVVSQLGGETALVGRQYAVLIAIDKYNGWMALRNPVKDAKEIKDILSRRYFISDFRELYDEAATKAGIIRLFNKLINDARPEDSILIFYAGHGHLDKTSNTGFWIPVDGGTDVDEQANWLPNAQIRGFISNMKARHVALIADSCFSGDFLNPSRGMAPTITNEYFKNAYARISRQVLTSGASESVPDQSPFTRQLKLALEGNTSPYLDPLMLYNEIRLGVTQTTPLFGDLKDSGHEDGSSFLLFLRSGTDQAAAQKGSSNGEELSAKVKIAKVYGTATVETDTTGTLFLDGVSQGQVPVGSLATIENLAAGPHEIVMLYDDGQKATQTVTIKMGKTSAVEFSHPVKAISQNPPVESNQAPSVAAAKGAMPPLTLLNGDPLPVASIKIDGNFDDWQNIRPVVVGSQDATNNKGISKVFLAVDAENFYIKLDIADKHFREGPDFPSYGITIGNSDSPENVTVMLVYHNQTNVKGWFVEIGVRERRSFTSPFGRIWANGSQGEYYMKGSSVEVAVPLAKIKKLLPDGGSEKRYRIVGWTAAGENSEWAFKDLRETEAGYFSFAESSQAASAEAPAEGVSTNPAAGSNQPPSGEAAKNMPQPLPLLNGGPLPVASIKIDGNFDDWKNIPPVAVGPQDATDNMSISKVYLAVDTENFYIRLDIADKTPSSPLHSDNFDAKHDSPSYGISIDNGDGKHNFSARLFHSERFDVGWYVETGVRDKDTFRKNLIRGCRYEMKGSAVEMAIPLAKIKGFLSDLGPTRRYRVFGWTAKGGLPTGETGAKAAKNWDNAIDDMRQTEAGSFSF